MTITIVTRAGKGAALSWDEMDANLDNLKTGADSATASATAAADSATAADTAKTAAQTSETNAGNSATAAADSATAADTAKTAAQTSETNAAGSAAAAATSATAAATSAAGVNLPAITSADAGLGLAVKSDGSGYETASFVDSSLTATTPAAGKIPISRADGTLDPGWLFGNINTIGTPGAAGFGVGICPQIPEGFTPLAGYTDPTSANYGTYQFRDGSVMVWIPKFWYRIADSRNPTYGFYGVNSVDITSAFSSMAQANEQGYALHRAFIDGGVEQSGFFVDKYQASKNAWGSGFVASSIAGGLPISTAADHNPIADLTACAGNYYYEVINACHARDGIDGAVNPASRFFCASRFQWAALAMISLAHGQAATSATYCAWYDGAGVNNFPKGCNNNALGDVNDSSIVYLSDGYSNCGKTGSGTPFAKTTHNGQACGVADLNGNMWEINLGLTRAGASATDAAGGVAGNWYALKESVRMRDLTAGWNGAADAWGDDAHLATLYDVLSADHITHLSNWERFGNGANQVLSEAQYGSGWLLTGLGLPVNQAAESAGGTNLFGADGVYEYWIKNTCPVSGAGWSFGSVAGVGALSLGGARAYSDDSVSFRAACYLEG